MKKIKLFGNQSTTEIKKVGPSKKCKNTKMKNTFKYTKVEHKDFEVVKIIGRGTNKKK